MFHTKNSFGIALAALPRIWECQSGQPGNKQDPMGVPTLLCLSVFLLTAVLDGQVPVLGSESGEMVRLPIDCSVLDLRESRSDLLCVAKAVNPQLGFDLRFHSGYQVNIRLRELPTEGDVLTMIFRVTSESQEMRPVCIKCSSFVGVIGPISNSILFVDGRLPSSVRWSEDSQLRALALREARLRALSPYRLEVT
jgi:hypothetical protein